MWRCDVNSIKLIQDRIELQAFVYVLINVGKE